MSEIKQDKNFPKTHLVSFQKKHSRKNTLLKKIVLIQEQNMGELSKNFSMSETKAAIAERAIQSLKHIKFQKIQDHGKKSCFKLAAISSYMNML